MGSRNQWRWALKWIGKLAHACSTYLRKKDKKESFSSSTPTDAIPMHQDCTIRSHRSTLILGSWSKLCSELDPIQTRLLFFILQSTPFDSSPTTKACESPVSFRGVEPWIWALFRYLNANTVLCPVVETVDVYFSLGLVVLIALNDPMMPATWMHRTQRNDQSNSYLCTYRRVMRSPCFAKLTLLPKR